MGDKVSDDGDLEELIRGQRSYYLFESEYYKVKCDRLRVKSVGLWGVTRSIFFGGYLALGVYEVCAYYCAKKADSLIVREVKGEIVGE